MAIQIPSSAWNWDTFLEGTHILIEPGPGGPRVWTFTANAAITAGQALEILSGSTVGIISDASTVSIGIAAETASSGAHVPVVVNGLVRGVTASGAITAGKRVIGAGAPAGAVKTNAAAAAEQILGLVINAASTTGNTVVMYVDAV